MQHDDDKRPIETQVLEPPQGGLRRAKAGHTRAYSPYVVILAIAGFFLARIPVLVHRTFDPDEFEHAHTAWCVFKGMIPYKDFFEHHTPFYHYMLSPFFHWFHVDQSFESARHFLIFARGLSVVLAILSVLLTVLIGRLLEDRGTERGLPGVGIWAGLLLVVQPFFFQKTVEIRPDVLALPIFLGSLWFLLRGLAPSMASEKRGRGLLLAGGLCLGASIMCTQKMLFVLPGLLAGLGIWMLSARSKAHLRSRLVSTMVFFLGLCVTPALTWAAFALHHGGGAFIANNFLLNSKWKHVSYEQLLRLIGASWPALVLGLLGASVSLYRFFRSEPRRYEGLLLSCILFGLIVGILIIPGAHRQYYLMLLPIVCLFAAQGLCVLVELAPARTRVWLFALAMIPFALVPLGDLRESFASRNDEQLARLRYVFEHTQPTDVVMDGIEGTGVFRPHALYHFFLHAEILDMLPRERVDAYVDALERGQIRPRLIALDENLIALGTRFLRFVKKNYVSSDGFFYFSKGGPD